MDNSLKDKIMEKFTKTHSDNTCLMNAMVCSKKNKFLFLHIAKTGGSSIVKLIKTNKLDDNILDNRNISRKRKINYFTSIVNEWEKYYKFTFVRNKYSQIVSLFEMDKDRKRAPKMSRILKNLSFENYIKNYIGNTPTYSIWLDQYYLTHVDDKLIFDFIGKFDSYNKDVDSVCLKLNIKNLNLHSNKGSYDNKKFFSYYNDETKKLLEEKFKKEFIFFKWNKNEQ